MRYANFANQEYMKKNLTLIDLLGQNERGEIPLIWKNSSNVNKDSSNNSDGTSDFKDVWSYCYIA